MPYPKIYLVMDNCFAIKRWVRPADWMPLIKSLGTNYIEASTDNEFDPLFSPSSYMDDWMAEVKFEQSRLNMKVVNFFTGYQTYRTAGLAHYDERVKSKLVDGWFGKLLPYAAELQAGIGFSFHALPETVLQNPKAYEIESQKVIEIYAKLAANAKLAGDVNLCCEQMYAPHQTPWRIEETKKFLADVYAASGSPFYTTVDVGHMVGQCRFVRPDEKVLLKLIADAKEGKRSENIWLGPQEAWNYLETNAGVLPASALLKGLNFILDRYPHLFAEARDSQPYAWLEELGAYSPIIHMQQTNGMTSSHAPFTPHNNIKGIIKGKEMLSALMVAYDKPVDPKMPPRTKSIYLSFEIFISNISYLRDALKGLEQSVEYWRQFIPEDGVNLKELVHAMERRAQ